MAEYKCQGPCGEVKDVETGFHKQKNVLRGHDATCKVCRYKRGKKRLEERRRAGERFQDAHSRYVKRKTDSSGNYIRRELKSGRGRDPANGYIKKGHPEAKYLPSPEKVAHESWLIRAENLFTRIFFCPKGIKDSIRCPMRHKVDMECFNE